MLLSVRQRDLLCSCYSYTDVCSYFLHVLVLVLGSDMNNQIIIALFDILLYIPTALPAFVQLVIFFTRHEISVIEVSTFDPLLLHYSFTCGRGDRG